MSSDTDTVFVTMYHPSLGNAQVLAPLLAVPTYQSHGWLLLDPAATPPPVATPFLTQAAADSRYVRDWAGAETVTAGAVRVAPSGQVIVRTADGTTRGSYDVTEQGAWTAVGGQTAAQLAADPALRAAFVPLAQLALNPDMLIAGAITRDANGAATSAPVVWPDGTVGTYTADTVSSTFPGAVDAYHVTYGSPATKTYTQPAVTRDATGAVTQRPALTVA